MVSSLLTLPPLGDVGLSTKTHSLDADLDFKFKLLLVSTYEKMKLNQVGKHSLYIKNYLASTETKQHTFLGTPPWDILAPTF